MNEAITLLSAAAGVGVLEWQTGFARKTLSGLGHGVRRAKAWVSDETGAYALLPALLPYRDFYEREDVGVIETEDGVFWRGSEVTTVATDASSNSEFNFIGHELSRVFAALPVGARVQILHHIRTDADAAADVIQRLTDSAAIPELAIINRSQLEFLQKQAAKGQVRIQRTFVFIGLQPQKIAKRRVNWKGLVSPTPWVDLEEAEFDSLFHQLQNVTQRFQSQLQECGAQSRDLTRAESIALIYERLNPERARIVPVPPYSNHDTNPRESLCYTNVDVRKGTLDFEGVYVATLSLQRLPVQTSQRSVERFLRSNEITFPLDISIHDTPENWLSYDTSLDAAEKDITRAMNQTATPTPEEEIKLEEIRETRRKLREGEEQIGKFGMSIVITAPNEAELHRRIGLVIGLLQRIEGSEFVLEKIWPMKQFIATLPAASIRDVRVKPLFTKTVANLSGLSGAATGLTFDKAKIIFQHANGGLVFFNQTTSLHALNHALICGAPGSGKSALMVLLRLNHLMQKRRGVVIDYRATGRRLVQLMGGLLIDITNPSAAPYLKGLFDINPRNGESFEADALLEGLPRDRIYAVTGLLEKLCEEVLDAEKRSYLEEVVIKTYRNLDGEVPVMDDFLRTNKNANKADRENSKFFAQRLNLYASTAALGRFFNQEGEAFPFEESPLICFDFAACIDDPRLLLVGNMAVSLLVDRILSNPANRKCGSFLHIDELGVLARSELLASTVDDMLRTARKLNAHITLSSQRPEDFSDNENLRRITGECPVRYLFPVAGDRAQAAFDLSLGEAMLVDGLEHGGEGYRECALISPSIVAKLHLRYNAVFGRFCLEAATGEEPFTAAQALAELPADISLCLREALLLERGKPVTAAVSA